MTEVVTAYIEVKHVGRLQYEAWIHHRPEPIGPFICMIMERGPYCAFSHRRAWRKAWEDADRPTVVDMDDL